jgi:hypothetical protein
LLTNAYRVCVCVYGKKEARKQLGNEGKRSEATRCDGSMLDDVHNYTEQDHLRQLVFEFALLLMRQFVVHVLKDADEIKRMHQAMSTIQMQILHQGFVLNVTESPLGLVYQQVNETKSSPVEKQAEMNLMEALSASSTIAAGLAND